MNEKFDLIIVGSSPISLIYAIQSIKLNKKIMIIDSDTQLGGAWGIESYNDIFITERACHLIEFYAGLYPLLEDLTAFKFVALDPQPIKCFSSGKKYAYSSKMYNFYYFLRLVRFFLKSTLRCCSLFLFKRQCRFRVAKESFFRILFILRYRILHLVSSDFLVQGPQGGWVVYIKHLRSLLGKVPFRSSYVSSCDQLDDLSWVVNTLDGDTFYADNLCLTESSTALISSVSRKSIYVNSKNDRQFDDFCTLLVSGLKSSVLKLIPYVHFPDNPIVKRITIQHPQCFNPQALSSASFSKCYSEVDRIYMLVQLRAMDYDESNLSRIICDLLIASGVFVDADPASLQIHQTYSESRLQRTGAKLRWGDYERLKILYSIGDLGISVLANNIKELELE